MLVNQMSKVIEVIDKFDKDEDMTLMTLALMTLALFPCFRVSVFPNSKRGFCGALPHGARGKTRFFAGVVQTLTSLKLLEYCVDDVFGCLSCLNVVGYV